MKKSKVILAIALAVILLVACLSAPTFSWFTRPYPSTAADYTGNVLNLLTKNVYTAYNGKNVTMTTTACTTGAEADYAAATSASGLGATNDVAVADRQYFCTTITNGSGTEQNISLYAANLHSSTNQFALGVNSPMRTYRDFEYKGSATYTKVPYDYRRVYMKRPDSQEGEDAEYNYWTTGGNYDVDYWDINSDHHYNDGRNRHLTCCSSDYKFYYIDIPTYTHKMMFKITGSNESTNDPKQKTEDINAYEFPTNSAVRVEVWHERNDYSVAKMQWYREEGADIYNYYSSITMDPGSTFDASLHYPDVQGSVKYYAEGTGNPFSVDENTGIITATGTGTGTLKTEVTGGSYNDKNAVYTTVVIQANQNGYTYSDVPIVKNLRIPVDSSSTQNEHENVIKVYWYIKKNSSSLSFKIDRIYLGP